MTSALGDSSCPPSPSPLLASLPLWDPGNRLPFSASPGPADGTSLQGTQESPLLWGPRSFLG